MATTIVMLLTSNTSAASVFDFGDAADPTFPSLLASNGARHIDTATVHLGSTSTLEADSNQGGDSADDGLLSSYPMFIETTRSSTGTTGYLNVLIDDNGDGDWEDDGERYLADFLIWDPGEDALTIAWEFRELLPLNRWIRLTVTDVPIGSTYTGTGQFGVGETEDYFLTDHLNPAADFGDAPDGPYPSLLDSDGARHIYDDILLGDDWSWENDSIQVNADEFDDGVLSFDPLIVKVTDRYLGGGTTTLNALIDANGDGDWEDAGEWIVENLIVPVTSGSSTIVNTGITVPDGWLRVTLTLDPIAGYTGTGEWFDGETEDYFVSGGSSTTTVSGVVSLQSVSSTSVLSSIGPIIVAESQNTGATTTAVVSPDGTFEFTDLPTGEIWLFAVLAPGFLVHEIPGILLSSSTMVLSSVTVRAGDVNHDFVVSIRDISAAAASFGQIVADRTDGFGRFVDVNGDAIVNIIDISAIASNFGSASPLSWP